MASNSLARTAFVCTNCRQKLAGSLLPGWQAFNHTSLFPAQSSSKQSFHCSSRTAVRSRPSWKRTEQNNPTKPLTDLEKLEASFAEGGRKQKSQKYDIPTARSFNAFDDAPTTHSTVPWYLQEQESQQAQETPQVNPFFERQRLPELPSDPPPIIQPLLNHLSLDLGLDYLELLDLRAMDPAPALGANLLMLFGSARSEKHLNVSADRLCRWLRSNYKLTPDADGLLGRNEFKLKMKRKNRRAKIMTAAGAAYTPDTDDGITTGWICVNAGSIENGPEANHRYQNAIRTSNFAGFGPSHDPAKLVVQILTEEKRNELDLESLWKDALDTSLRRKAGAQRVREKEIALQNDETDGPHETASHKTSSSSSAGHTSTNYTTSRYARQQTRGFHSSRSRYSTPEAATFQQTQPFIHDSTSPIHTEETKSSQSAPTVSSTEEYLKYQLDILENSDPQEAMSLLGKNENDMSSTKFLQAFYDKFPQIPEPVHLRAQLHLQCHAVKLGCRGYTVSTVLGQLHQLQACAVPISEDTFLLALEAALLPNQHLPHKTSSPTSSQLGHSMTNTLSNAFEILSLMESNGHNPCTANVLTHLSNTIESPTFNRPNHDSSTLPQKPLTFSPKHHAFYRFLFSRALEELATTTPKDTSTAATKTSLYLALMHSYLTQKPTPDFSSFWNLWHQLPRIMLRRPPEMYALMFEAVARTGPAHKCQTELMRMFPEMQREDPPVACEEPVAGAVLLCLKVAEVSRFDEPWRGMWEAAEKGLLGGHQ